MIETPALARMTSHLAMVEALERALDVYDRVRERTLHTMLDQFQSAITEVLELAGVRNTILAIEEILHVLEIYMYFGRFVGKETQGLRSRLGPALNKEMGAIREAEFAAWRIERISGNTIVFRRLKTDEDAVFKADFTGLEMLKIEQIKAGSCFAAYRQNVAGNNVFLFPIVLNRETASAIEEVISFGGWQIDEAYELDLMLLLTGADWEFSTDDSDRFFEGYEPERYHRPWEDPEYQLELALSELFRELAVWYHWSPMSQEVATMVALLAQAGPAVSQTSSPGQEKLDQMVMKVSYRHASFAKVKEMCCLLFGLSENGDCEAATAKWRQTPLYALDLDWSTPGLVAALKEANMDPATKLGDLDFRKLDGRFTVAAERHRQWCRWVELLTKVEHVVKTRMRYYPTSEDRVIHNNVVAGLGFVPAKFLDTPLKDLGLDKPSLRRFSEALDIAQGSLTPLDVAVCSRKLTDLPGIGPGTAEKVRKVLREGLMAFAAREPERPFVLSQNQVLEEIVGGLSELEALFSTDA